MAEQQTEPDVSVVIVNKDERALADTLRGVAEQETALVREVVVVDASAGRLDDLKELLGRHDRWIAFTPRADKRITIADQRNAGVAAARAPIVVFIDSGCTPDPRWLERLTAPIRQGAETVTVGRTTGTGSGNVYEPLAATAEYLDEAPTINLAFTKAAFTEVGGFDEDFDYGSDVDFTWRLRHAGHRLRMVGDAAISHDWGGSGRQLKRAFQYGAARGRLYTKHPREIRAGLRRDPIVFAYPAYLLALPLSVIRGLRWIPALMLVPLWRARGGRPLMTLADHLAYGAGVLAFVWRSRVIRRR